MPKKKKPEEQGTGEKVVTAVKNVATAIIACGHINRQHHNADNELEDLACTLDKGHKGAHSAEVDSKPVFWSDAAGTPVKKNK
jgi:hypothetical protein